MFGVEGVRVLAAGEIDGELHLLVEQVEGSLPAVSSPSRTGGGSTCCATLRSGTARWS